MLGWLQENPGGHTDVMVGGTLNAEELAPSGSGRTFSHILIQESLERLVQRGDVATYTEPDGKPRYEAKKRSSMLVAEPHRRLNL